MKTASRAPFRIFAVLVVLCLAQAGWWIYFQIQEAEHSYQLRMSHLEAVRSLVELQHGNARTGIVDSVLALQYPDLRVLSSDPLRLGIREDAVRRERRDADGRVVMFISEGVFFLLLILGGMVVIYMTMVRDARLQRQQNNFILSVTHEFKSPLASLKLYLQTILAKPVAPDRQRAFLENGLGDIDRLQTLIDNVLAASRIEHGGQWSMEPVNLSEVAENVLKKALYIPDRHRIETSIETDLRMTGDSAALYSVIDNLLDNALKYSNQQVRLSLAKHDGRIELRVEDRGPGIDSKYRKLIFQKFFRIGDEMTRRSHGTGLGLFLVDQIIQRHGGTVDIRTQTSGETGTMFIVSFPAKETP